MYRLQDIESDHNYSLAPAQYEKSVELAHIVKYAWLEAYDEVAGVDFTRKFVPKCCICRLCCIREQWNHDSGYCRGWIESDIVLGEQLDDRQRISQSLLLQDNAP